VISSLSVQQAAPDRYRQIISRANLTKLFAIIMTDSDFDWGAIV